MQGPSLEKAHLGDAVSFARYYCYLQESPDKEELSVASSNLIRLGGLAALVVSALFAISDLLGLELAPINRWITICTWRLCGLSSPRFITR